MSGVPRHIKKGSSQTSKVNESLYIKGNTMKQTGDHSGIINMRESLGVGNDEYKLTEGIQLFLENQDSRIQIRNNNLQAVFKSCQQISTKEDSEAKEEGAVEDALSKEI